MTDPTRADGGRPVEATTGSGESASIPPEGTEAASPPEAAPGEAGESATVDGAGTEAEAPPASDPLAEAQAALADRTADLQRLQAEYLNYKRRVDRDRELVRENAKFAVLSPIIEVLDTIDRAREHGELEGGFKAVADQLERVVAGAGLTRFGEPGDPFDPSKHEALSHIGTDPEVVVTTCQHIAKAGYMIGDRVVRAAQVLVVDPAEPAEAAAPTGPSGPAEPVEAAAPVTEPEAEQPGTTD